jgi:hypothetical protein
VCIGVAFSYNVRSLRNSYRTQKLGVVKEMLVVLSQRGVYNPADDTLTTAVSAKASAVAAAKRNVSAAVLTWLQVCAALCVYTC